MVAGTEAPVSDPLAQRVGSEPRRPRIVVGVDGSDGSLTALRWAIREGFLRGQPVHAVLAWRYHPTGTDPGANTMGALRGPVGDTVVGAPSTLASDVGLAGGQTVSTHRTAAEAHVATLLDTVITEAEGGEQPGPDATVTQETVEGHPAKVLLERVSPSDLLVVGARGHSEFVGALLGSVSHHVVMHAPCPVVVVPHSAD